MAFCRKDSALRIHYLGDELMDWLEFGYLGLFIASFLSATVIPFSSEAVLAAMLVGGANPWLAIGVATSGNWLGGMSSYGLGYLGKWEWLERYFGVERERVVGWKPKINRYGSIFASLSFLPIIGDAIAVALGFFRADLVLTSIWMAVGKFGRYLSIYWGTLLV